MDTRLPNPQLQDARLQDIQSPEAPQHAWQVLHPPAQHHDHGWLAVGDGHALYWEQGGHPGAPAALFVHGGPGAGCTADDRRWFDPRHWRTVLFDQRGCGRSRTLDPLRANTTAHAVADMEALRVHLGLQDWLLFGGSWGSTLALAYAQAHPQRVRGVVLRGVFLGTRAEGCWLYGARGAALRHPAAWQRLCSAVGVQPGQALLSAMQQRLQMDDAAALDSALAWCRWEHDLMDAETTGRAPRVQATDPLQALRMARIGVHYACAGWFLDDAPLLARAERLHGLPAVIVQGVRDLVTPRAAARALHTAWPGSQLIEVPCAGHASSDPTMARHLVAATAALAQTVHPLPHHPEETCHVRHQRQP